MVMFAALHEKWVGFLVYPFSTSMRDPWQRRVEAEIENVLLTCVPKAWWFKQVDARGKFPEKIC
jgi:hypothetical protein